MSFVVLRSLMAAAALATPAVWAAGNINDHGADHGTERIYARTKASLVQVRTLVKSAQRQSTLGSGFVVDDHGLALTNYHVVSQFVLEPQTYRLEYLAPDGSRGALSVMAIDIANDLAVVKLDRTGLPALRFDDRAVSGTLPKGERLYAMGNPLNLGFTIVEGTYNGLVERSWSERIHYTGALNPGMSGGPAVTTDDRIAGVNVAKQNGSDLVSFLVPARYAAALLDRARTGAPLELGGARAEIGRQLAERQRQLYADLIAQGFKSTDSGPYQAPESRADWFTCWAHTNSDDQPRPRALADTTQCNADTGVFLSSRLSAGSIRITHSWLRGEHLNAFQFASFLSSRFSVPGLGAGGADLTPPECHEDLVGADAETPRPLLRVAWCARAYRDFPALYNVSMVAITQDRGTEALDLQVNLQAVDYAAALDIGRRLLGAVQWKR